MKVLVIIICKIIRFFGKLMKRGSSLPGYIAIKLDKNILSKMDLPENIIMVTGSNGKTTTTEMIASSLKMNGYNVGTNEEGSNQIAGVATMIINNSNIFGKCKKDALVIESDERYAKDTCKYIHPKYLVVTNLYRDQMTRNAHPESVYEAVKDAVHDDMHLILNSDDPLSSMLGYNRDNVTYVGIEENQFSTKENNSVYNDGVYCPVCKGKMKYEYYHFSHIGKYECTKCEFKRANPLYKVTDVNLSGGYIKINGSSTLRMHMKGYYNAYNLLYAFTVLSLMGIEEEKIVKSLDDYTIQNDRVQEFNLNKAKAILLTSKHENSINYNQNIDYVIRENKEFTICFILDAISRKYFTTDTSWLWDIDFEKLDNPLVKKIVLAGRYSPDLAIRFNYTNIDKDKIVKTSDLDEMMKILDKEENDVYVLTCFADRMKFIERARK